MSHPMSNKRWTIFCLILILGALLGIVGGVCLVDPFEIYHQATAFIPPIANGTQNYSNAGVAKSYEYDSVVIGSSMTENFTPSQLDSLFGGRFVKLPINGGSPFNHKQMMDLAFGTHDVKRVLYGVDVEALTWFYKTPKCEMPEYLYDDNFFNDTAYWFNSSVLLKYIPACLRTLGQSAPDLRDTMYNWGDMYEYGKDAALRDIRFTGETVEQKNVTEEIVLSQQSKLNVEYNFLPYIENHPDTEFLFFFPPYSLAHWYSFYQKGDFEYHLIQKEALTDILLQYENVKVYDFQARTDWILNLDHYIDSSHYGPWINDAMGEAIARDEYRVLSAQTVQENNDLLRRYLAHLIPCSAWPDDFSQVSAND